ncbi:uncharacterized protein LOC110185339 isoform X1 [Drosophila serrata]|uniref:uncharacterized protein LOC110185339 isoform X1 n=1 Tax=Drosophila serrata TaxID=7274 RepID=UPI000A1CFC9D|nr:uncharacterized protein LOC110185339 isoform X1 [Drosophila serrata]
MRHNRVRGFGFNEMVQLIEQVHAHTVLWDVRHKRHLNGAHLKKAWESVAAGLNKDPVICKTAWQSLRDSHRYYSKMGQKKGSSWVSSRWSLSSHLSFLPKDNKERWKSSSPTLNPLELEDSLSAQDKDFECEEAASQLETDISSLIEESRHLDKDLSNWTGDLCSSIGKREELSPIKEEEHKHKPKTSPSRPIFAYWESLLNKMAPEDADAAEQQMTQTLWAEMAAIKYNKGR